MIGFSAYYLQNPFLLPLVFVKNEYIPATLYYMEALQLSLAGFAFQVYISNAFKKQNLVFSTAYALCGFYVGYFTLPIYFCDYITLPFVMLGLYMIFDRQYKKGSLLYIITLTLSIFFNYYIGYMICIFAALCAVYLLMPQYGISSLKHDKALRSEVFCKIKVFILSSFAAVMLSVFDLLPTVLSLSGQKDAPDAGKLRFFRQYRVFDSFTSLFTGSFDGNISNVGFPNIYVGVIPAFFALCFFLNKNIRLKKRIAALAFICVMILSLNIHTLNVMWHAFNEPVGFGYRFTFLLSFLLLVTGYSGYLCKPGKTVYITSAAIVTAYAVYAVIFHKFTQPRIFIISDIVIIFVALAVRFIEDIPRFDKPYLKRVAGVIFASVCIFELMLNGLYSLKINISGAKTFSEYKESYERVDNLINAVKSQDDGFYRIEKDFQINMQDAMTFDYNGLSHNSSCETDTVKNFMGSMGFRNQGIFAFYNQGSTTFADMLLGVKYFVSRFDSTDKPYEPLFNIGSDYVYKNVYALPVAFFADKNALDSVHLDTRDLFKIQNDISGCFYFNENIYEKAETESVNLHNLEAVNTYGDGTTEYCRVSENDEAYIEFNVKIKNDDSNLYFFFDAPKNQGGIRIFVNDADFDDYFTDWRFNIERAGRFEKGSTVNIRISVGGGTLLLGSHYIYEENLNALKSFDKRVKELGLNKISLTKLSSSHLKGEMEIPENTAIGSADKNNTVIFTIPYDSGWHVKIDGNSVNTYKTLNTLLALDLSSINKNDGNSGIDQEFFGKHEIDMYFIPKGIIIGSVLSVLTLVMLIFVYTGKRHFFRENTG